MNEQISKEYSLDGYRFIDINFWVRLCWKQAHTGFDFIALKGTEVTEEDVDHLSAFEYKEVKAEPLIKGSAAFDGVRHVYFGDEGYVHYPNWDEITTVLKKIEELEYVYTKKWEQ